MGDGKLKEVRTPEKMGVRRSGNSIACFLEVQKCSVESPVVIHALSWNLICCQDLMQNTTVWRVNSEMTDCVVPQPAQNLRRIVQRRKVDTNPQKATTLRFSNFRLKGQERCHCNLKAGQEANN